MRTRYDRGWCIVVRLLAARVVLVSLVGIASAQEALTITDAWVRHAPSSAHHHAGYLTLANSGHVARSLVTVESSHYAKVELHVSRNVDGVSTMEPVAQVEVAPGQTVRFAPGGLHLMLIDPKAPVKLASSISLTLAFSDGTRITTQAVVRRDGALAGQDHGGHAHHTH